MKIQLPIDTSAVPIIDVMPPSRYSIARPSGRRRTPTASRRSAKSPGNPPAGIRQGMEVRIRGPMLADWAIGDRFGLSFRAAEVEPLSAADAATGRQARQWCGTGLNR
jgi:hypothetical protein